MNANEQTNAKRRLNTVEIVLLVLGSPIWLSLGVSALAVIVSLYLSLWAVFASFAAGSVGGATACVVSIVGGNVASGLAMLSAGMVCAGLSIFIFYGCKAATKGILVLTKKTVIGTKNFFIGKEEA